jgi:uncharacterized protein (DUF2237 family)
MASTNVLGTVLRSCSTDPLTGFFRDGVCRTCEEDQGSHTVCAEISADFLAYSQRHGNDLSTPMPQYGFPGLQPGDRWCVCASRWLEAERAGCAPPVSLLATDSGALEVIPLEILKRYATA